MRRDVEARCRGVTSGSGRFEDFYRTHYVRVRRYVSRRVAFHDVDDMLVETFSIALRRWADVPRDTPNEVGWLLVTARHVIGNHHRSVRRERALAYRLAALAPTREQVREPTSVDSFISDSEIERVFHGLSVDDQLILTLVAWDECTPEELGAFFDCASGAAKTRLSRARARFRDGILRGPGRG